MRHVGEMLVEAYIIISRTANLIKYLIQASTRISCVAPQNCVKTIMWSLYSIKVYGKNYKVLLIRVKTPVDKQHSTVLAS